MPPPVEAPVAPRPAAHGPAAGWRAPIDTLSAYLPLLLMGLLALGTWWLVKNTPQPGAVATEPPLRHLPDYTMKTFNVQRFAVDGTLRAQIEGDVLRHYPDTDTLEVDNARIVNIAPGSVTQAVARLAVSNADATEVQLLGGAHVVQQARQVSSSPAEPLEFRGEFLHAFQKTERLCSHLPVVVTRGGTQLRADSMDYDNLDRVLLLNGHVRAAFLPTASAAPRAR